jgi:hypothetical protein
VVLVDGPVVVGAVVAVVEEVPAVVVTVVDEPLGVLTTGDEVAGATVVVVEPISWAGAGFEPWRATTTITNPMTSTPTRIAGQM